MKGEKQYQTQSTKKQELRRKKRRAARNTVKMDDKTYFCFSKGSVSADIARRPTVQVSSEQSSNSLLLHVLLRPK